MTSEAKLWGVETEAQELAQQMVQALSVTMASVALLDSPSFALTVKGFSAVRPLPMPLPVGVRIPLSRAQWHRLAFERQEPVLLLQESPARAMPPEEVALSLVPCVRSISLVPILFAGEPVGILGLGEMRSHGREPFTQEKLRRCRTLLEAFLTASRPAWEARRLRQQARAWSALLQTARGGLAACSVGEVLAALATGISGWLGVGVGGGLLLTQPPGGLRVVSRWNLPEAVAQEEDRWLLALARSAGERPSPASVVNVAEDPLDPLHPAVEAGEAWSRVVLPFVSEDRLFGVACLYIADDLRPTEWELETLQRMGEVAAVGMGVAAAAEEREREREWLARAGYALLTAHRRTVLRGAITGILHRVSTVLPGRLEQMAAQLARPLPAEGGDPRGLAEALTREVAASIQELQRRLDRAEEGPLVPLEINEVVRRAIGITREIWEEGPWQRGVRVEVAFDLSPEPLIVETSLDLVGALVHAIENAAEAIPEGGRISIRTAREGDEAVIVVEDTGPGVPEELWEEAFAPFFSTKVPPHLGLGLTAIRVFARRYRGEATLARGEAGGAALVLRLPVARSGP